MRRGTEQRRALSYRLEQLRRRTILLFEVERLGETDRQLDALGGVERGRVDHSE